MMRAYCIWMVTTLVALTACDGALPKLPASPPRPHYAYDWDMTPLPPSQVISTPAISVTVSSHLESTPTPHMPAPAAGMSLVNESLEYQYPPPDPALRQYPTTWGLMLGPCQKSNTADMATSSSSQFEVASGRQESEQTPQPQFDWVLFNLNLTSNGLSAADNDCLIQTLREASARKQRVAVQLLVPNSNASSQTSLAALRQIVSLLVALVRANPSIQAIQVIRPVTMNMQSYGTALSSIYGAAKRHRSTVWVIADIGITHTKDLIASKKTLPIWGAFADCVGMTSNDTRLILQATATLPNKPICNVFERRVSGQGFNVPKMPTGVLLMWLHNMSLSGTLAPFMPRDKQDLTAKPALIKRTAWGVLRDD